MRNLRKKFENVIFLYNLYVICFFNVFFTIIFKLLIEANNKNTKYSNKSGSGDIKHLGLGNDESALGNLDGLVCVFWQSNVETLGN